MDWLRATFIYTAGLALSLWNFSANAEVSVTTVIAMQVASSANIESSQGLVGGAAQGADVQWVEATTLSPGDSLRYTLKVKNNGLYVVPKGHLRIEDAVPPGSYLAQETFQLPLADVAFFVSADGQQFVPSSSAVGPARGWRFLRWEYLKSLAPQQSFDLVFRTRLSFEVPEYSVLAVDQGSAQP